MKKEMELNKKAQNTIGLSFGTIFSIFLMIFFVVVAGIAINYLIKTQQCAKIGIFIEKLNKEVTNAWHSQKAEFPFNGNLPSKIEFVCFTNLSRPFKGTNAKIGEELSIYENKNANLFFYPPKKACQMPYHKISYLDTEEIIKKENPYCFSVNDGLVNMNIIKGFSDKQVKISR